MARTLTEAQVARITGESRGGYALFLGAGASISSEVPGAGQMIAGWRRRAHEDAGSDQDFDAWLAQQPWRGRETEYSELFALVCPGTADRQRFIESQLQGHQPGWGYLYLANLMAQGWFSTALTTNFDNLLAEALSRYAGVVAAVCASDSDVLSFLPNHQRPQILKLHGDYLFLSQRHTLQELESLGGPMRQRFIDVLRGQGLLVLGYGGRDRSIMRPLHDALQAAEHLGPAVYWGLWRDEAPSTQVAELAEAFPDRFHLFRFQDFDAFAARVHGHAGLPLPAAVMTPYAALRGNMGILLKGPTDPLAAAAVQGHRAQLQGELDRIELLRAHQALARRQPGEALPVAEGFVRSHPDDAFGHAALAGALMQQAEDSGQEADARRGIAELREAVRLDPHNVGALYGLAMAHSRLMQDDQAIDAMQRLLPLAPKDKVLRANLAQLYVQRGRAAEATTLLAECLRQHPDDPRLLSMWAQLLVQNGDLDAALTAIDQAIALDDGIAGLHNFRAQALAMLYRPQAAVQAFRRALALDPANTVTRLACARLLLATGDGQSALEEAGRAVRDNPDSAEALGLLGQVGAMMGPPHWPQALLHFDALVLRTPRDARAWAMRGLLLGSMQRFGEAERDLTEAVRLTPDEASHRVQLAQFYNSLGRFDRVQGLLSEIHRLSPQTAMQLQQQLQMQAWMQQAQGRGMGPMQGHPGPWQGAAPSPGPWHGPGPGQAQAPGGLLQRFLDSLR